jgi:hypothetical protein
LTEQRLLSELARQARAVKIQVGKLRHSRYPTETPMHLANIVSRLVNALADDLMSRHYDRGESGDLFVVEVQTGLSVVRKLASHLRFVERATTRRTPWSLIEPLERLGRTIHKDSEFIIRPQWIFNYSIADYLGYYKKYFENVLPSGVLTAALTLDGSLSISSLYIVTFPFMERLNALLHTLISNWTRAWTSYRKGLFRHH